MRGRLLLILACTAVVATAGVIPRPAEDATGNGAFVLRADSVIVTAPGARAEATLLAAQFAPATGFDLAVKTRRPPRLCGSRVTPACHTWITFARSGDRDLGDEGYRLDVRRGHVLVRARGGAGWFYGAQTLRQLLPPAVLGASMAAGVEWTAPVTRIRDVPRFAYRGVMLDAARHFFPPATVRRLIDQIALHKLNRLHWHLSDDQGWRLEIRAYPELTVAGAMRTETANRRLPHGGFLNFLVSGLLGPWTAGFDGTPYAGHYSQDDVRAIVAYAAARHVEIVPEIDMPGHIQAAISAYPSLGSGAAPVPVKTSWGLPTAILSPRDETFTFIDAVLGEVAELFPGRYIHMGGDEVGLDDWKTNADAQAKIAELHLPDEKTLQFWFVDRVMQMILDRGRRPIGWNEVLNEGLPGNGVVMAWTSAAMGLAAAQQGHDVIMAPIGSTYLDHANGLPLPAAEESILENESGGLFGAANLFVTDGPEVYAYDPIVPEMTADQAAHVLGGQGQLWAEFIHDETDIDRQAFPRLCALAEVLWTPAARRDLGDFQTRLAEHLARLGALGIGYYRPPS